MSDMQRKVIKHAQDDMARIGADAGGPEPPGVVEKVKDYLMDRVLPEIGDALMHKVAHGAAELSQGLNSQSNAYVPYGIGQAPLAVEDSAPQSLYSLHDMQPLEVEGGARSAEEWDHLGKQAGYVQPLEVDLPMSHEESLRRASKRPGQEPDHGIDH